jgi:hypothetical protein
MFGIQWIKSKIAGSVAYRIGKTAGTKGIGLYLNRRAGLPSAVASGAAAVWGAMEDEEIFDKVVDGGVDSIPEVVKAQLGGNDMAKKAVDYACDFVSSTAEKYKVDVHSLDRQEIGQFLKGLRDGISEGLKSAKKNG